MEKRIELEFMFKSNPHIAYVLIRDNEEGYTYIVNLFDKKLNENFSHSYTFIAKDNKFFIEKPMSDDQLELINAIKDSLRNHPNNPYSFTDFVIQPKT